MIEDVKVALRISHEAYDGEIVDLIEAAIMDLYQSGVTMVDETDPLIKRAIITYSKANFGFDNPEADRFHDSYVMLKQHLALAGDYHVKME